MKKNRSVFIIIIMALTLIAASCSKEGKIDPKDGYYTCSMHPQVIQQEPGLCPICNMTLVLVKKSKGKVTHDHSKDKKRLEKDKKFKQVSEVKGRFEFIVADELIQNAKISTVVVKNGTFHRKTTFSGHVDYNEDPNRLVVVNTKYNGWVEKLYVSKEGQWINRGNYLMGIYSPRILAAKEEFITTYNSLKTLYTSQGKKVNDVLKDPTLIASKRKLLYLDVPLYQVKSLINSGTASRLTYFYSPISGVIVKKSVLQGSFIKAGQELFRIADLRVLWVFIHIFEKDLPFVKKGQKVKVISTAYPDKKFNGHIDLIYPFFQRKTRDVKVRVITYNTGMLLKPGMFVTVDSAGGNITKSIIIPDNAIIYSGTRNYVFVSKGQGRFELRPVVVKARSQGKALIIRGLKEKELIVSNGQFLLDSEASLKEAIQKGQTAGHKH